MRTSLSHLRIVRHLCSTHFAFTLHDCIEDTLSGKKFIQRHHGGSRRRNG